MSHHRILEDTSAVVLRDLRKELDRLNASSYDNGDTNALSLKLSQIKNNLVRLEGYVDDSQLEQGKNTLTQIRNKIENKVMKNEDNSTSKMPKIVDGKVGNNKYDINKDKLQYLLSIGVPVRKIAREGLLGGKIHHKTIFKFVKENNISSVRASFTIISDFQLVEKVKAISLEFPNSGIREISAIL